MPTIRGIYTEEDVSIGHLHSSSLSKKLSKILNKDKTVIDFGCGMGDYIRELKTIGYNVIGIDGINASKELYIKTLDMSNEINLGIVGSVISLEVGEHIPEEFEEIFINNLVTHCDDIMILSWAIIGQIGIGHVNCRNNDYIIDKLKIHNLQFDPKLTDYLRVDIEEHCNYFNNTLMVFRKL